MILIKHTQHNLAFAVFLKKNGFITGFSSQKQYNKQILTLFLKYNYTRQAAVMDFSLASKITKPNNEKFLWGSGGHVNFLINMCSAEGKYGKLLSRFR